MTSMSMHLRPRDVQLFACTASLALLLSAPVTPAHGQEASTRLRAADRLVEESLRIERLETLADLWGKLYLFHPYVVTSAVDWEQVLIAAIPHIEAAASTAEFIAALNRHLFAPLGDPLAFARHEGAPASSAGLVGRPGEIRRIAPTTAYLDATDPFMYEDRSLLSRTAAELGALGPGDTLIVDLRWPAQEDPGFEGIGAWLRLFARSTTVSGYHVTRQHEGWAEDRGALSCQLSPSCLMFSQGWQTEPSQRFDPLQPDDLGRLADGASSASLPTIAAATLFLVNNMSVLHLDLVLDALQFQENIRVVWERTGPFTEWGAQRYPEGVTARLGAWILVSRSGDLGYRPDLIVNEFIEPVSLTSVVRQAYGVKDAGGPRPRFDGSMRSAARWPLSMEPLSREERLLGLFKVWTVVGFLSPHLEHASIDWPRLLPDWIPRVEAADGLLGYYLAIRELSTKLNDNHVGAGHPVAAVSPFGPNVRLQRVQGRVIVAEVRASAESTVELRPGDEVISIDGRSPAEVEETWRRQLSASTPQGFFARLWDGPNALALRGPQDSPLQLVVARGDRTDSLTLRRTARAPWTPRDSSHFSELPGNLGYINTPVLPNAAAIDSAVGALRHVDGLILDLRQYPRTGLRHLVRRLADTPLRYAGSVVPTASMQHGRLNRGAVSNWAGEVPPLDGLRYLGPVVVLINGVPQSHPESVAMWLKQNPRVRLVGSPTAGTTGEVSEIWLPGGGRFLFTGRKVTHLDGGRFQNIGVIPDVLVEPTIEGIRQGRDEILEKGIEVLRAMVSRVDPSDNLFTDPSGVPPQVAGEVKGKR
jgi:C-terminal processing protease CtpA/Prc